MSQYSPVDAAPYTQQLKASFLAEYSVETFQKNEVETLFWLVESLLKRNPQCIGGIMLQSLYDTLLELHQDQISLNPSRKQASVLLAPYFDSGWIGVQLCKSYRGYRDAAVKAGKIKSARPTLVYEQDRFEWVDSFSIHKHSFDPFGKNGRGKIRGSYCVAELPSGRLMVTHFTMDELMQTYHYKQVSESAWQEFFEGMLLAKTVRLSEKSWAESGEFLN